MKNVSGKILKKNGRGRILKDDNCFMKKITKSESWAEKNLVKFRKNVRGQILKKC